MDDLAKLNGIVANEDLPDIPQTSCKSTLTFQNVKFVCELEHFPGANGTPSWHKESGLTDDANYYSVMWQEQA